MIPAHYRTLRAARAFCKAAHEAREALVRPQRRGLPRPRAARPPGLLAAMAWCDLEGV